MVNNNVSKILNKDKILWYNILERDMKVSLSYFLNHKKGAIMYSPRISTSLIPIIYKKAKQEKKPMTKIVNDILREKLNEKSE